MRSFDGAIGGLGEVAAVVGADDAAGGGGSIERVGERKKSPERRPLIIRLSQLGDSSKGVGPPLILIGLTGPGPLIVS